VSSTPEPTTLQDVLQIELPEQLKALGHPLRLKVLQVLGASDDPLTNRELAALSHGVHTEVLRVER